MNIREACAILSRLGGSDVGVAAAEAKDVVLAEIERLRADRDRPDLEARVYALLVEFFGSNLRGDQQSLHQRLTSIVIEATLRAEQAERERDEAVDAAIAVIENRPQKNGQYVHAVYCSGSRHHPPTERGHSCCCPIGKAARAAEAERDEARADRQGDSGLRLLFELQDTGKVNGVHSGIGSAVRELVERLEQAETRLHEMEKALRAIAEPKEPNSLGEPLSRLILAQEVARRALFAAAQPGPTAEEAG